MVGVGEQQRNYDAIRRPHSDTGRGDIPLLLLPGLSVIAL